MTYMNHAHRTRRDCVKQNTISYMPTKRAAKSPTISPFQTLDQTDTEVDGLAPAPRTLPSSHCLSSLSAGGYCSGIRHRNRRTHRQMKQASYECILYRCAWYGAGGFSDTARQHGAKTPSRSVGALGRSTRRQRLSLSPPSSAGMRNPGSRSSSCRCPARSTASKTWRVAR